MTQILTTPKIKRWTPTAGPVMVPSVGPGSPKLVLRPMNETDIPVLASVIRENASHLFRWLPVPDGCKGFEQTATRWVNRAVEGDANGSAWRRLATLPDGTIVGGVNLIRIERGLNWQADLNWWVSAQHSGRGFATELVLDALAHAFADMPNGLGLHRVHAGIQPGNTASERVAAKAGFTPDQALNSKLFVNGQWQTHRGYVAKV